MECALAAVLKLHVEKTGASLTSPQASVNESKRARTPDGSPRDAAWDEAREMPSLDIEQRTRPFENKNWKPNDIDPPRFPFSRDFSPRSLNANLF